MAILTSYAAIGAGQVAAGIAANAGGDSIAGDGRTKLLVQNPTGAAITLTIASADPDNFGISSTAHDQIEVIAAGAFRYIGPFAVNRFNDANQRVQLTYSAPGLVLWPLA